MSGLGLSIPGVDGHDLIVASDGDGGLVFRVIYENGVEVMFSVPQDIKPRFMELMAAL